MKILLTGASGFIGQRLLKNLIALYGADCVVALTSAPIEECAYVLHEGYSFDKEVFIAHGHADIEVVIHAGAFTPKSSALADSWDKCTENIANTQRLLSSSFPCLRKVILLSTLDVYGGTSYPIDEGCKVSPASLYGHSKLYCEQMLEAWAKQTGCIHQILRVGHVYGPGEEQYAKIIPTLFRNMLNGSPIKIYGEGTDLRSFIYIEDVVAAICNAMQLESYAGPINIVSNDRIAINDLVGAISTFFDIPVHIERVDVPGMVSRNLVFDNRKMRELLCPQKTDFLQGLRQEYEHMKQLYEANLL